MRNGIAGMLEPGHESMVSIIKRTHLLRFSRQSREAVRQESNQSADSLYSVSDFLKIPGNPVGRNLGVGVSGEYEGTWRANLLQPRTRQLH